MSRLVNQGIKSKSVSLEFIYLFEFNFFAEDFFEEDKFDRKPLSISFRAQMRI